MAAKATPAAVQLAIEKGIALVNVRGTGFNNFITLQDVQRHVGPWSSGPNATQSALRLGEVDDAAIMSIDVDAVVAASSTASGGAAEKKQKPPGRKKQKAAEEAMPKAPKSPKLRNLPSNLSAPPAAPPAPPPAAPAAPAPAGPASWAEGEESLPPLHLVLDLDNTLVHAAEDDAGVYDEDVVRFALETGESGQHTKYVLRLRDGVADFLESMKKLGYLIHVYTMGSYSYTQKVLDLLDPAEVIFAPPGKILCRPEGGSTFKKSLAHLFPDAAEWRRAIIVDDRTEAWDSQSQEHLLQLHAYYYFGRVRRDAGMGSSLGGAASSAAAADCVLFDVMAALRSIHEGVSTGADVNVPTALKRRRREMLRGVCLVFSGGLLKSTDLDDPTRCMHWAMATAHGASCSTGFTDQVTHVISPRADTNSVRKAKERALHAVTPQWLEDCAKQWRRLPEAHYSL